MRLATLAALVVGLVLPAPAARDAVLVSMESGVISIVDVATRHVRSVTRGSEPTWSPRGDRFAFTRDGDVFVLSQDGGGLRRLTRDVLAQHNPVWSPDGTRIAYLQQHLLDSPLLGRAPQDDVAVVDLRTGAVRQLTTDQENKRWLTWSPDGRTLAYEIHRRFEATVMLIDAATGEPVGVRADGSYPVWSPGGKRIAYVTVFRERASLVVARSDGTGPRALFRGAGNIAVGELAWSPSGRFLVFVYGGRLELADTRTGRVRLLLVGGRPPTAWLPVNAVALPRPASNIDGAPAWSQDGRRIAFDRYDGSHRRYALGIVNRDGTRLHFLLRSKRPVGAPLWRPRAH